LRWHGYGGYGLMLDMYPTTDFSKAAKAMHDAAGILGPPWADTKL